MSENICNKCNDNIEVATLPPLNCGNQSPCVETNTCSEITGTACIVYEGEDIINGETVIAEEGMPLNEVLENLSELNESSEGCCFIEVTVPELQTLISNEGLISGATYKINGVHKEHTLSDDFLVKALYNDGTNSGITIFLKAVSTNKLENFGSGVFYNPKYDFDVNGFGKWTDLMEVSLGSIVGDFQLNETVQSNNGAIGVFITKTLIKYVSGNWATSTSISGSSSLATANISSISIPIYNINDVVFYGGYAWRSINGNISNSTSTLALNSSDWLKLPYSNTSYYNEVIDYVEYDINNDLITRRKEEEYNIDCTFDLSIMRLYSGQSHISYMHYGGGENLLVGYTFSNIICRNSVIINVNVRGWMIHVEAVNGGIISDVIIENDGAISNVLVRDNGGLVGVVVNNGFFNYLSSSFSGGFRDLIAENNGQFSYIKIENEGYLTTLYAYEVVVDYVTINTINLNFNHQSISKAIGYLNGTGMTGSYIIVPPLNTSTIIFNTTKVKNITHIIGATNDCKLITRNTSGVEVVNDIDD